MVLKSGSAGILPASALQWIREKATHGIAPKVIDANTAKMLNYGNCDIDDLEGKRVKVSSQLMLVLMASILASTQALAAPPAKSGAKKPAAKPAAKANPGPSSGGSSAAFNNYATQMRQKMAGTWNYPSGDNHVTLTVEVAADGSVSNLTLVSNPKNTEAEQKANDAFNSAQPLQPLPTGVQAATISCQFNSKADQWDSKADIGVKIDPKKSAATEAPAEEKKDEEKK